MITLTFVCTIFPNFILFITDRSFTTKISTAITIYIYIYPRHQCAKFHQNRIKMTVLKQPSLVKAFRGVSSMWHSLSNDSEAEKNEGAMGNEIAVIEVELRRVPSGP